MRSRLKLSKCHTFLSAVIKCSNGAISMFPSPCQSISLRNSHRFPRRDADSISWPNMEKSKTEEWRKWLCRSKHTKPTGFDCTPVSSDSALLHQFCPQLTAWNIHNCPPVALITTHCPEFSVLLKRIQYHMTVCSVQYCPRWPCSFSWFAGITLLIGQY